jgi:two-component sensor histidine kinase
MTMKGGPLLKKIIYSSWFLAAVPALILMLLLHPVGSTFKLEIESAGKKMGRTIYADLNSDSISEVILGWKGISPYYSITVRNIDFKIHDQWNLADSVNPLISEIFFGNYDHDRFREIYIFTYKGDSLFLNLNEILEPSGTKMERIFIDRIGYSNGQVAAAVMPAGFYDENGDGKDELYFSISSSYTLGTRRMYYFDLANRSLKSTRSFGSILLYPKMEDVDNDRRPEIFGMMSASGNYRRNVPYSDSSTWFMVFDDRLIFKFPPIEFRGFANALFTSPYKNSKFHGYILSHVANGTDTTVLKSGVMIYSREGEQIKYRRYDEFVYSAYPELYVIKSEPSDRIYVLSDKYFELNDSLQVIRTIELPFNPPINSYQADVDGDGKEEFLLYSEKEKELAVYSASLNELTEQTFKPTETVWKFYPYLSKDHEYKLFLASGEEGNFLKLKRNKFYLLGYAFYPGIYFVIFFFIVIIKRISAHQLKTKEGLNNRLITLQLQGIKAQLDPHFTFNTLNSVASLIYLEDRQTAYDYMRKFTQLLRSMLNDAEKIYRTLEEEIDFLTNYLELEKMRFGNKFDFQIEIGEGINLKEMVPKLVLQTFAENAVKHGIMPSETGGIIKILIKLEKGFLKLTIEDNGVGREYSAGHSNSTGKGLKLASEFYEILNSINKRPVRYQITDLYDDEHKPAGTRVEVWVPSDEYKNQPGS